MTDRHRSLNPAINFTNGSLFEHCNSLSQDPSVGDSAKGKSIKNRDANPALPSVPFKLPHPRWQKKT